MLGTHQPNSAADGVAHEGYGGWTWSDFVSKFEPDPDGKEKCSSPFVFSDDGSQPQLNMHRYFQEKCDGQVPDYVVIMLGINDCFSAPADDASAVDVRIDNMLASANQLLDAIRTAAPKTQIGFCLTTPPNARQEAFEANYSWLQSNIADSKRTDTATLLKPFWRGDVVEGEPVLFVRDSESAEATGSLLFPISEVLSVRSSSGEITYEAGKDYRFVAGTHQIMIPVGSRVVTTLPSQLRRPDGSQRHKLTHRDGNGEILFGGKLEYHQMQTSVTYKKADNAWPVSMPSFDPQTLPATIAKLRDRQDVSIVLLGDSISTGCNASGWGGGAPFQPAFQDLLAEHLEEHYGAKVKLTNLSVGGMSDRRGASR